MRNSIKGPVIPSSLRYSKNTLLPHFNLTNLNPTFIDSACRLSFVLACLHHTGNGFSFSSGVRRYTSALFFSCYLCLSFSLLNSYYNYYHLFSGLPNAKCTQGSCLLTSFIFLSRGMLSFLHRITGCFSCHMCRLVETGQAQHSSFQKVV